MIIDFVSDGDDDTGVHISLKCPVDIADNTSEDYHSDAEYRNNPKEI